MIRSRLVRVPATAFLSTGLLLAVGLAWAVSPWRSAAVAFYSPAGHLEVLGSDRAGLLLFVSDLPFSSEVAWTAEGLTVPSEQASPIIHKWIFDPANAQSSLLGFGFSQGSVNALKASFRAVLIPYWAILPPLALLPIAAIRRRLLRWQRRRMGLCRRCGYDLRRSPDRCPECGATRSLADDSAIAARPTRGRLVATLALLPGFALMLFLGGIISLFIRHAALAIRPINPESFGPRIADIDFHDRPIAEAIADISRRAHTPVRLPRAIGSPASDPKLSTVSLHLHEVSLATAVRAVLQTAFGSSQDVLEAWLDDRGELSFGYASDAPRCLRTYCVEDLLRPRYSAADIAASQAIAMQLPLGNQLFSGGNGRSFYSPTAAEEYLADLADSTDTDRDESPGEFGAIVMGNRLVMRTTQRGHYAVARTLYALRCAAPEGVTVDPPGDNKGSADMEERVPDVELGPTFQAAINTLADATHANILVDWQALKAVDVVRTSTVHLHLWDISLRRALNTLFAAVGNDGHLVQIVAAPRSEVIWISTTDALYSPGPPDAPAHAGLQVRIYDVLDVIEMIYHRSDKLVAIARNPAPTTAPVHITVDEAIEYLTKMIEDFCDVDSWKDNGGSVGALREFNGWLVITQTPEAHAKIVQLLRFLRNGGDLREGKAFEPEQQKKN
jgi:hypothetical protein